MPKSIQALREERKQIAAQMTALVNKPEDQNWSADDQKTYDDLKAAIGSVDAHIDACEETLKFSNAISNHTANTASALGISDDEAADREVKLKACTNAWLRGGVEAMSSDQREFMSKEVKRVSAAMGTGEANNGQALTHREFVSKLTEAMKAYGGMREVATILSTDSGNTMDFPTTNATAEEGEIVGENTKATELDTTFGTKSLGAFKYSSKSIAIPFELLQDASVDIESYIIRLLAMRLSRIQNKHFTIGEGTTQPTGVVTAASVGKTAAVSALTFSDLNHLVHSVDPAYRESGNCKFMFNDMTLRDLKDLKDDTTGRPLWLPGFETGDPDRIYGYGYTINQNMENVGVSTKPVAFGDMSAYHIRDVRQLMMFRMTDSAFTLKGQVGFVGFLRADGNLMDVGGAVKVIQNAAS